MLTGNIKCMTPPSKETPSKETPHNDGQSAGGTHPTGMHSCSINYVTFIIQSSYELVKSSSFGFSSSHLQESNCLMNFTHDAIPIISTIHILPSPL